MRIAQYLERPSLWLDEAMVALNIGRRSFAGLATTLDWSQLAPVPWLWLEKLVVANAGMHEWSLRAPALVVGICLPWLVWLAGRKFVGDRAALVATILTTASGWLLFYSNETKPYILDAAITVVALAAAARILTQVNRPRSWTGLGLTGIFAILVSFPAVLVLGGIGVALMIDAIGRRDGRDLRHVLGWGAAWLAAFALPQLLLYRHAAVIGGMAGFWEPATAGIGSAGLVGRLSDATSEVLATLTTIRVWPGTELYLLVMGVGAWQVWRRAGLTTLLMLVGPVLLTGLAWGLNEFPIHLRLTLFLAPIVAFLLAAGLIGVIDRVGRRWRPTAVVLCVMLVLAAAVRESVVGLQREKPSGGRAMAEAVLARNPAPIWLSSFSTAVWLMYSTDWSSPDTTRLDWFATLRRPGGPAHRGSAGRASALPDQLFMRPAGPRGLELLARPSGLRSNVQGPAGDPLPSWAGQEADRIVAEAKSGVWIMIGHDRERERNALINALRLRQLVVDTTWRENRGSLLWARDERHIASTLDGEQ